MCSSLDLSTQLLSLYSREYMEIGRGKCLSFFHLWCSTSSLSISKKFPLRESSSLSSRCIASWRDSPFSTCHPGSTHGDSFLCFTRRIFHSGLKRKERTTVFIISFLGIIQYLFFYDLTNNFIFSSTS